ncbi:MAG: homoserine O-acetyltransferase [Candidatus Cryptobacteroides sp.]|nr:homoserine O-acetyltransferase [Candidatus Cryptobacteroides sp.]
MMIRRILETDGIFRFENGGELPSIRIAYYCSDREYRPSDRVIWFCHALTGNANPEDWWPQMVGPGCVFDPEKDFVVCVSMIASPYGECSPLSVNPETGKPYLLSFPRVSVRDMVRAAILVRKALGIESIDLLLGPSIGGFQALEWAVMEPSVMKKAVFLATGARVLPYLTAFNEAQRMALKADPSFLRAEGPEGGSEGLKAARAIALISYRTFEGYNSTQAEQEQDTMFADRAASYERYQGDKLLSRGFDAYSYWYLSYAVDSQNLGRGRGGVEAALSSIKARAAVISIDSDVIFPPSDGRRMAESIPGAEYYEMTSTFGHDGFLIEYEQLKVIIQKIL